MKNNRSNSKKIFNGVCLAIRKLIAESKINDDYLVISRNGKVVKIRARDL